MQQGASAAKCDFRSANLIFVFILVLVHENTSVCMYRGRFTAGDKVTYNGTELLCHGCVSAPERPTHVTPVQSVATRPQEIPVGDQLHSPDSVFSTSGKHWI